MGVDECWPCNLRTNTGRITFKNCINDGAGGIIKKENRVVRFTQTLQIQQNCISNSISLFFPPSVTVVIISFLSSQNTRTKGGRRVEWPGGRQWSSTRVVPLRLQPAWIIVNNRQPRENNDNWCVRCLSDMHKLAQDGEPRTALHPTAPPSDCDLHGN